MFSARSVLTMLLGNEFHLPVNSHKDDAVVGLHPRPGLLLHFVLNNDKM